MNDIIENMHKSYCRHFSTIGSSDHTLIGSKGMHLAQLFTAGFPVPHGFCITSTAYEDFIDASHLDEIIRESLDLLEKADNCDLNKISESLRLSFMQAEIPKPVRKEIMEFFHTLEREQPEGTTYAVRSSSTAEDLPGHAFPGQYDTFLNLKNEDDVVDCVKKCWASLWTERALSYRIRHGIEHHSARMAVIIQTLTPAIVAGVAFTINPVIGDNNEILINANWGLGESVVSGKAQPDLYRVGKKDEVILHKEISEKKIMVVPATQGTEEQSVPVSQQMAQCLPDNAIQELA